MTSAQSHRGGVDNALSHPHSDEAKRDDSGNVHTALHGGSRDSVRVSQAAARRTAVLNANATAAYLDDAARRGYSKALWTRLCDALPKSAKGTTPSWGLGRDFAMAVEAVEVEADVSLPRAQREQRAAQRFVAYYHELFNGPLPGCFDAAALAEAQARNDQRRRELERQVEDGTLDATGINAPFTHEEFDAAVERMRTDASSIGCTIEALLLCFRPADETSDELRDEASQHCNDVWERVSPGVDLTTGKVTPVHKGGSGGVSPADFRAIAVPSAFAKLLQTLISTRLYERVVNVLSGISALQAGFIHGRSTGEQLVLTDQLQSIAAATGQDHYTVFLDLYKAYGTTDRDILMDRLANMGVDGRMWLFLYRWLHQQRVFVQVGSAVSDTLPVQRGILEGAVWSPLLFLIHINPLLQSMEAAAARDPGVGIAVRATDDRGSVSKRRIPGGGFADDIVMLATSMAGCQKLLDICSVHAYKDRLVINVGAAKTAMFLPRHVSATSVPPAVLTVYELDCDGQRAARHVPVPAVESYTHLGLLKGAATTGTSSRYDAARERSVVVSRRLTHAFAVSGITDHCISTGALAHKTCVLSRVTANIDVWGHKLPAELEADNARIMRMLARAHATAVPAAVLHATTGVEPVQATAMKATLRRVLSTCSLPRHSPPRQTMAAELDLWATRRDNEREQLWIHQALAWVDVLDETAAWWATWAERHTIFEGDIHLGPASWRQAVAQLLMPTPIPSVGWAGLQQREETALLRRMKATYRNMVMLVFLRRRVEALRDLPSLDDVRGLSYAPAAPPFTSVRRSRANQLRVQLRGGIRTMLGWPVYECLRPNRTDTNQVRCVYCDAALTVSHLLRDSGCTRFAEERRAGYVRVRDTLSTAGLAGPALSPVPPAGTALDAAVEEWWFYLLIGEAVPEQFAKLGLQGWRTGKWTTMRKSQHTHAQHVVYAKVLSTLGHTLVAIVEQLTRDIEAKSKGPGLTG